MFGYLGEPKAKALLDQLAELKQRLRDLEQSLANADTEVVALRAVAEEERAFRNLVMHETIDVESSLQLEYEHHDTPEPKDRDTGHHQSEATLDHSYALSGDAWREIVRLALPRIEALRNGDKTGERARRIGELTAIAVGMAEIEVIKNRLQNAVDGARDLDASWYEVGIAAGITAQAALRRWNPEAKQRRLEYERSRPRGPQRPAADAG
jgi:hypothetical protein